MFFVFGISTKEKELDFHQTTVCKTCASYGSLKAYMTYSYFSLFFIPIFKWNKKYYIKSTCCGTLYSIDKDLGRSIERGESINISDGDLNTINRGHGKICPSCNHPIEDGFTYCPKCGEKL